MRTLSVQTQIIWYWYFLYAIRRLIDRLAKKTELDHFCFQFVQSQSGFTYKATLKQFYTTQSIKEMLSDTREGKILG